jgi:hypothetical protein
VSRVLPPEISPTTGDALARFEVSLLRFTLRAVETVELPPFAGSTFRGAFGGEFRRLACLPHCHDAAACEIAVHCAYARVFEAKPSKQGYTPVGDGGLPRPFLIHPPEGGRLTIEPGKPFTFYLALIGWAADYVPYFILAWRELGLRGIGRGRGRFRLETVESCGEINPVAAGVLVYSSEDELVRNPGKGLTADRLLSERQAFGVQASRVQVFRVPPSGGPDPPNTAVPASQAFGVQASRVPPSGGSEGQRRESLSIEFLTPLRLKSRGEFLRGDLPFSALAGALMRRLETLSFFYGAGSLALDYSALMERAREVGTGSRSFRWVEWERYSYRQDRRIPWGGIVGQIDYAGDFGPFLPFLALGEIIGVGNGCAFGLGRYRCH